MEQDAQRAARCVPEGEGRWGERETETGPGHPGERAGVRDKSGPHGVWDDDTLVTDADLCSSLLAPWLSLSGDDSGDLLPGGNLPPEADPHGANTFPATS